MYQVRDDDQSESVYDTVLDRQDGKTKRVLDKIASLEPKLESMKQQNQEARTQINQLLEMQNEMKDLGTLNTI